MGFQDNRRYGTLEVTAGGNSAEYDQRITPDQAQQREGDIARSKPGAPKSLDYAPAPIKFKRKDKRGGEVHATQYSARIRDYDVRFTIQTNDKAFLEKARQAIEEVKIFCTDDSGRFFTPDGRSYVARGAATNGPTIPTAIVDEAIGNHPAEQTIPQGKFADGKFRIPELDFSYTLPAAWTPNQRPPAPDDEGVGDTLAERLLDLWHSCARTVLDATPAGERRGQAAIACVGPGVLRTTCSGGAQRRARIGIAGQISTDVGPLWKDQVESPGRVRWPAVLGLRRHGCVGFIFGQSRAARCRGGSDHTLRQAAVCVVLDCSHNVRVDAGSEFAGTVWKQLRPSAIGPGMLTGRTTSRP